jgi:hypothetical protein
VSMRTNESRRTPRTWQTSDRGGEGERRPFHSRDEDARRTRGRGGRESRARRAEQTDCPLGVQSIRELVERAEHGAGKGGADKGGGAGKGHRR